MKYLNLRLIGLLTFCFTLCVMILSPTEAHCQSKNSNLFSGQKEKGIPSTYYAYCPDGKINFNLSTEKILIKFKEDIDYATQTKILSAVKNLQPVQKEMFLPSPKVVIAQTNGKALNEKEINELINEVRNLPGVAYVNPLLIYEDGTMQAVMNRFFVKLKKKEDVKILAADAEKNHFKVTKSYQYDPLLQYVEMEDNANLNALTLANALSESKKYAFVEVDFLKFLEKYTTNDPFLNYQWSLNNTGSTQQFNGIPGADMKVFDAWAISNGSPTVKVAVIDEGVDLAHPDLVDNLLPGYDGTNQGSNGAPQGNDAHGTSCAGIIAAKGNNNIGITGIAYNSKIIPVRIAYSSGNNWVTSDAWISTCIDWAWNQGGADVLSNSWGGGSTSTLINDAISRATTLGRSGKGSAVLFAAGNNNGSVSYPGSNANVIAVIAMSMCNQRKSPSSCDGESFWGSNYGVNADIAAPGVKIYTTDISGAAGYRAGDYMETFNGTSSACPNAAGVMALVLSVNPNLTYAQARAILESSCEKVGGYAYNGNVANQPNGAWSLDLGYGRVNALAAVQMANPQLCTGAPSASTTLSSHNNICNPTNVTLSLPSSYTQTGISYQWQISNNNVAYTNIAGATNNFVVSNVSTTKWFRCKIVCTDSIFSTPIMVNYIDGSISTFPATQNFTTSVLPCGWSVQNVNNDAFTWAVKNTGPRTSPYSMVYSKTQHFLPTIGCFHRV